MSTKFSTSKRVKAEKNGRSLPRVNWKNGVRTAGALAGAALLAAACSARKPAHSKVIIDNSWSSHTAPADAGLVQEPEPKKAFEGRMGASIAVFANQIIGMDLKVSITSTI